MSIRTSMTLTLTLLCTSSFASEVFRCEYADGHIVFSQHGCQEPAQQSTQRANNPPPGGNGPARMATAQPLNRVRTPETQEVVVVGARPSPCPTELSDRERRVAIIQQRIRAGMTRADVESAFGKPDRITTQNAQVSYLYKATAQHGLRSIRFDEQGCVKAGGGGKQGSRNGRH
ncbi:MAG: hypothetical protein GAK43_00548 [Stenotrophomonas maltophilia]|nr:MAG: hypothetical protein GAK43_00548 [Stenotrophomonas maltophilia]